MLRVEDRGIGMSPDQYAELNERLATPPMVDVAVSRMMGLVVVARLAARHGVKVELLPSPDRGTVADVLLPSGVLVPRALAGRTHAPSGFPAIKPGLGPEPVAAGPARPNFGPPLALESGPGGGAGGWDDGRGRSGVGPPTAVRRPRSVRRRLRMVPTLPTVLRLRQRPRSVPRLVRPLDSPVPGSVRRSPVLAPFRPRAAATDTATAAEAHRPGTT